MSTFPEETSITLDIGGCCEKYNGTVAEAMLLVERCASFATPITWTDTKEKNQFTGCNYVLRSATQLGSDNQPRHVGTIIIKGVTPMTPKQAAKAMSRDPENKRRAREYWRSTK